MKLTSTEKYLVEFLDENVHLLSDISITELSKLANVSTTTIFRTVKKLGYSGFAEYKIKLMSNTKNDHYYKLLEDGNEIQKIISKNKQEVNNTIDQLNIQSIDDSLNYLKSADRILIFSQGLSSLVAEEIQIKFLLLNKRCEVHTDPYFVKKIVANTGENDCVLFISLEGETTGLVESSKITLQNNVPSILITSNSNSSLANNCDVIIHAYKSNTTYFPDYEVRSRLSLNVIARILLDAYANRYGS